MTTGLNILNVRDYIVRPACKKIGMWSMSAERQVTGTGAVESGGFMYLDQLTPGPGPAYGLWQMEKATHDDIWTNFLEFQPSSLVDVMYGIAGIFPHRRVMGGGVASIKASGPLTPPPVETLHWNLMYGAAMCRLHYRRVSQPLPDADDYHAMAAYWKEHYNTPAGRGTLEKAVPYFKEVVYT